MLRGGVKEASWGGILREKERHSSVRVDAGSGQGGTADAQVQSRSILHL